jgi:hypothetical protein
MMIQLFPNLFLFKIYVTRPITSQAASLEWQGDSKYIIRIYVDKRGCDTIW